MLRDHSNLDSAEIPYTVSGIKLSLTGCKLKALPIVCLQTHQLTFLKQNSTLKPSLPVKTQAMAFGI